MRFSLACVLTTVGLAAVGNSVATAAVPSQATALRSPGLSEEVPQEGDGGDGGPSRSEATSPDVGLHPGGGGLYVRGPDYHLRLLGYIQPTLSVFPRSLDRPDGPAPFSIRRARVDLLVELHGDYTLFLELDGAPAGRTALVEAWLDWRLRGDALRVRAGKFIGAFSTENARSSRAIDTVERFMALNAMFLLPALDTQTGAMLHGAGLLGGRLGYSLGLYNGNGSANVNIPEDNASKEVQAKLTWSFPAPPLGGDRLEVSAAFDLSREEEQVLRLADLGFNTFAAVPVVDRRWGFGGDLRWIRGPASLRAEGLAFRFRSPDREEGAGLRGGFLQPAWFLSGDEEGGLQLLLRAEWAGLDGAPTTVDEASPGEEAAGSERSEGLAGGPGAGDGVSGVDALYGVTLGANYFPNANARLQVNAILTRSNGASSRQGFDEARWTPMLLTQLQFKF